MSCASGGRHSCSISCTPSSSLPTMLGLKIISGALMTSSASSMTALSGNSRGVLNLIRPVERGFVKDWDNLEHLWQHCYQNELKVDSAEHPLLYGLYPDEQKSYKERMAYLFFESLNVTGLYCSIHGLLSLYATGKTSGVVIDSGDT